MAENTKKYIVMKFFEGLGIALIVCLASVLLLALVVQNATLGTAAVRLITEFVKVFAVFIGCFFGVRGSKGWLKGAALGVCLILCSYFLFALISLDFSLDWKILLDILFGFVAGAISGAVAVNVKKRA